MAVCSSATRASLTPLGKVHGESTETQGQGTVQGSLSIHMDGWKELARAPAKSRRSIRHWLTHTFRLMSYFAPAPAMYVKAALRILGMMARGSFPGQARQGEAIRRCAGIERTSLCCACLATCVRQERNKASEQDRCSEVPCLPWPARSCIRYFPGSHKLHHSRKIRSWNDERLTAWPPCLTGCH